MSHLILLGDSIFDNGRYTAGGPDLVTQVRGLLPSGWDVSLLALDGSTTDNIANQLQRLPHDATRLVMSVGGNNALMQAAQLGISLFGMPTTSTADTLETVADISSDFGRRYRATVDLCLQSGLPLSVCTIYDGNFPDPKYQRMIATALMVFNDVILRVAIEHGLSVIDLRQICTSPLDYANPIEPSSTGGEKIARAIVGLVTAPGSFSRATRIIGSFC